MKRQIKRLSPHQNAKVFAVLMSISSLFIVVPMVVFTAIFGPSADANGNPVGGEMYVFLIFPVLYLIIGYLSTLIGSCIYNYLFRFIGGIEFDMHEPETVPVESGADTFFDPHQPGQ